MDSASGMIDYQRGWNGRIMLQNTVSAFIGAHWARKSQGFRFRTNTYPILLISELLKKSWQNQSSRQQTIQSVLKH